MKKYMPNFIPSKLEDHHDYVVYRDVRIPMRDGVEIGTNIYFPATNGEVDFTKQYPVILNRTAYMGTNGEDWMFPGFIQHYAVELGYAVAQSGCRGRYKSGGEFKPMADEGWGEHKDGVDVVNWFADQSWCNGKIAMTGMSWTGGTQYLLWLADEVPDSLVTSCISNPAVNNSDGGWVYKDEFADQTGIEAWTFMNLADQIRSGNIPEEDVDKIKEEDATIGNTLSNPFAYMALSIPHLQMEHGLANIPAIGHAPWYKDWLAHRDDPDYFAYCDTRTRKHDFKKPLLFMGSWFDLFSNNALDGYQRAVAEAPSEEVAEGHRLIVGPWPHVGVAPMLRQFPNSRIDMRMMNMEWIQQQVNGFKSEFFADNKVTLFDVGTGNWRSEKAWPLPDAQAKKLYLHSMGPANTMMGLGTLSEEAPAAEEPADNYVYDPADPIIQQGSNGMVGGQADQRGVEMRPDVLCFTTPVLTEDVDVTGYVKATLYAATTAEDTDFFMKLVDVCPDGNCYNLVTGGRRGRYVKNGRKNPTPLTPGEIVKYEMELHSTCCTFRKGHRIRVEVCSSDALNFDINPNAFIDLNTAKKEDYVTAAQTVYHDAEHPSFIELPIVSADHEYQWLDGPIFDSAISGFDYAASVMEAPILPELVEKDRTELPTTTPQPDTATTEIEDDTLSAIRF